jgi:membrane-associated phospholipid phosphatase
VSIQRVLALLVALLAVVAAATVTGLLVTRGLDGSGLHAAEAEATRDLVASRTPTWTTVSAMVTRLADTPTVIAVAAGVLVVAWRWGRRRLGLYVVAAVAGETLAFLLVTLVVERPRPPVARLDAAPPTSSYPSGHTAAAVALYGSLAVVAWRVTREALLRWGAAAAGLVVPALVALSRLYRGMHWPTDVIAGAVLGVVWLAVTTRLVLPAAGTRRPTARQRARRPAP